MLLLLFLLLLWLLLLLLLFSRYSVLGESIQWTPAFKKYPQVSDI